MGLWSTCRLLLCGAALGSAAEAAAVTLYECPGNPPVYSDRPANNCRPLILGPTSRIPARPESTPPAAPDLADPPAPMVTAGPRSPDRTQAQDDVCRVYREYVALMQKGSSVDNGISIQDFQRREQLVRLFSFGNAPTCD